VSRTIAIGDIHGCSIALTALIEAISPRPDDIIVPLGDYVDRGIDSKVTVHGISRSAAKEQAVY